ncbi:SIS domain-containing protein [Enterococcus faecalis]|uniref:SIS domain-containing protein n=1 Tax=Enterococcus faecalis TaxID=1351 RepID=UPI00115D6B2A|nr:SIS domain-containing protein [Enterococcus faecalis]EGO2793417.1 SIS domain-containing protein [Enterococcus faecalis]EJR1554032.1 SIS domain-containing protein [Enterococcus faecalis]NRC94914.1 SIS domain-containing protein [Enterococcus faecalis]NSU41567.1 SIS domain-containing protein [Enterococcus faecalis]NSV14944.1 SIS domain-containing protein [Enterococcus faecalis]
MGTSKEEIKNYLEYLTKTWDSVVENEVDSIDAASELIFESCKNGGRFYVFGSGHSHMVAEEIYIRAGGLAYVKGILPPELMLHEMPNKSTYLERLDGYSKSLLNLYKVDAGDTIMVVSNSGRNNIPVEMCIEAKKKGAKVIALTAMAHSTVVSSRHSSGKNIYEIADVTIDSHAPKGDAAYRMENVEADLGPTSDFTCLGIAQTIIIGVISRLRDADLEIPVFKSSNLDGADEYNDKLFDKYYGYWK